MHTTRHQHAEERRNQLLDTAVAMFAREGVENTSIKELALAAGVAQGLLYHYFASKEDMLLAALERHNFRDEMRCILQPSEDRPVAEVLLQIAMRFDQLLGEREELTRILLRQAMIDPLVAERWTSMVEEGNNLLAAYLATRIATGELGPHDPRTSASMLLYTIFMRRLTGIPTQFDARELVQGLLRGIAVNERD